MKTSSKFTSAPMHLLRSFLLVLCIPGSLCFAQWQADQRLTVDPANSFIDNNNGSRIASNGETIHAVWHDGRNGGFSIYYKRSTDGGSTWGTDIRLTNVTTSTASTISASGNTVHIAWMDNRDGNFEIYYKRSTDAGSSWSPDTRMTTNASISLYPSVSSTGSFVHITWMDERDGNDEIYYKRSTDAGISWSSDTRLTTNSAESSNPSVSSSGQTVNIAWNDYRDGNAEIYHKFSSDAGASWGADMRLTSDPALSQYPSISTSGQTVCVSWLDGREGNPEIFCKVSTNSGSAWSTDQRLTVNPFESAPPFTAVSEENIHIAWFDDREGNFEIFYKTSTNTGAAWGPDTRLTTSAGESYFPTISISGSAVNILWMDKRDGNWEIYYKKNPTGNLVSITSNGNEIPKEYSLGQNYPNPFNPKTNFELRIADRGFVSVKVYDISGKQIAVLVNENLSAGIYNVDFDASHLASGLYFYKMTSGEFSEVKKMVLIK